MKTTICLFLAVFCLSGAGPQASAVSPPPDGGYAGFTTAEGTNALKNLTTGIANTAAGWSSLFTNSSGSYNTGLGAGTLVFNNADSNTAVGTGALLSNTTGFENTANGTFALLNNNTGAQNTAFGFNALLNNTTAGSNSSGSNTAVGAFALWVTTTGGANTAIGYAALGNNTGGSNIALGDLAGVDLTTGNGNIDIGNRGVAVESATIRIGNVGTQMATFIAGISETAVTGAPVVVDANGQLGVASSSERFKKEITTMEKASEAILSLRPVTFHYKTDAKGTPQFGLIAEEVEKVNPDLIVRNHDGKPYTVRYDAVNAMLLNEFLKEHEAFVEGQHKMQEQGAMIACQQKQIEALTAGLQKLSAQLAAASPSLADLK
jgi:hypothetical protein